MLALLRRLTQRQQRSRRSLAARSTIIRWPLAADAYGRHDGRLHSWSDPSWPFCEYDLALTDQDNEPMPRGAA